MEISNIVEINLNHTSTNSIMRKHIYYKWHGKELAKSYF